MKDENSKKKNPLVYFYYRHNTLILKTRKPK